MSKLKFLLINLVGLFVICVLAAPPIELDKLTFKNPSMPYLNIIAGGQPAVSDLKVLADMGVKNIINLRSPTENNNFDEKLESEKLGFNYISLPIEGAMAITVENAQLLSKLLANQQGVTFVHCASSNRVGALFALKAALIEHKSVAEAVLEGKRAGLKSLTTRVEAILNLQSK